MITGRGSHRCPREVDAAHYRVDGAQRQAERRRRRPAAGHVAQRPRLRAPLQRRPLRAAGQLPLRRGRPTSGRGKFIVPVLYIQKTIQRIVFETQPQLFAKLNQLQPHGLFYGGGSS